MSSYDVQIRNLYPLIKGAVEKAHIEYDLGLSIDIETAEAVNISKAITDAGYRLETVVADEIFAEIYEDCFDQFGYINYEALAELKKKYLGEME